MTLAASLALHFASPASLADWGRIVAALVCGVVSGMALEVMVAYRRSRRPVAAHVRTIAASYLAFSVLLTYANLRQIGVPSPVAPVTIPLSIIGGVLGVVGLFRILRLASGKQPK